MPACSFMLALPTETEQDLDQTIALCKRLATLGAGFSLHILAPHKGTRLYDFYSNLIEPYDVYGELEESESFYREFRQVCGDHFHALSPYLPDTRWVRPEMPLHLFHQKFHHLKTIMAASQPSIFTRMQTTSRQLVKKLKRFRILRR
jgi:radical SAM superfamily enzyme YgiQ (UPF0313 family)